PASLPMEPVVPMSVPIPPVGFQLVRDPNIGGLLLLPSAEPLHQAVVWPSYSQPPSHVLLPQIPPPPLQLLSSASSDYLSSSTTLHQHTQTHSTRLVAVTTDTKRKIPLPIPATTLIKIETDATSLDQTKTLQAVSTIASNTATVFTDQNVAPLVTTHVIYQHPTNLILSQTPAPETACRSQATSPVTCLTPPPENMPQNEEETLGVQDASNQTESPICSEDDVTAHAIADEIRSKPEEDPKGNLEDELPNKVPEIEESAEATPKTLEPPEITQEDQENEIPDVALTSESPQEECKETEEERIKPDSTQEKIPDEINMKPDLSGLELLSSIVEFENRRETIEKVNIKQEAQEVKVETEQNEEVLKGIAHMTLKDRDVEHLPKKVEDSFGGLDLLCALAEQRILEEVTEKHKLEIVSVDKNERNKHERKKEKRKSRKHSDEPKHKRSKYNLDEKSHKHSDRKNIYDKYDDYESNEFTKEVDNAVRYSNDINKNQCFCRSEESYRTYKTRESEEEVKKFIASKSQPLCCKGDWPCMNPNELDMRKKLADLQRKYREKQKELNRLKVKKHADHKDCSKKNRSRKKSTHSDKDRETPPPLLDKMDVPLKPNKNNQELLKPPTLCAYGNENVKLASSVISTEVNINNKVEYIENSPIKRCYTPSIDLSDSTPEKISSSKKRKVGRPKKLLTSSGLRTGTETIVAKKPKKGNIVGYLLAAKEKLMQNKNGQLYSNSPPRFVEDVKEVPKHRQHKSKNDENRSKRKHDKKDEKSKIRPKLKAEPMVKKFAEEEEIPHEWSKEIINKEVEPTESEEVQHNEETNENKENIEDEVNAKDQRCTLTSDHLETDKLRVLTAMGGLFYAGHLNAVQPPDVYSITLDGERGNKPHIMSREEILRDAIVEVAPASTEELLVGTRICAYWSQQYRCLYPGSVAEPGTPDPILDSKFVCVEFDDGDSGRIALDDIRLLPPDYPIIEYDPNPLLSLSKRRRRTSTAEDKQRANQSASNKTMEPSQSTSSQEIVKDQDVEKENKDTNKVDSDSHRERKRLKKRKREKLREKLQRETKKKKRKHKCSDENCKHKKHHKKHRKHRKHHHKMEEETKLEATEIPDGDDNENRETEDEQQDSFEENSEELPEYEVVGNPEDEVTMDDILEDKKKKSKKIRDRQESCESRSKMSAFLPARQLWGWSGKGYWRSRFKGRIKKQFYKAIQRGKETILVGDSAVFLSTGRPDRPYIGKIEAMWEACGTMVVKVKWFYHPEETIGCPLNLQYPGALFESPHVDENDVQTISHKCEVLPLEEYTEKLGDDPQRYATIYDNNDIYYLAGYYDPTTTTLKIQPNIPFLNAD
ncbi:hypothetical protein AMK59_1141, partial [Oryctes borbonicus]